MCLCNVGANFSMLTWHFHSESTLKWSIRKRSFPVSLFDSLCRDQVSYDDSEPAGGPAAVPPHQATHGLHDGENVRGHGLPQVSTIPTLASGFACIFLYLAESEKWRKLWIEYFQRWMAFLYFLAPWRQCCGSASPWCGFDLSPWCKSRFWFLFDADPDQTFHPDADPDPVPNPSSQMKAQTLEKMLT